MSANPDSSPEQRLAASRARWLAALREPTWRLLLQRLAPTLAKERPQDKSTGVSP